MKWKSKLLREEEEQHAYSNRVQQWHKKFAWKPIMVYPLGDPYSATTVWLSFYSRRLEWNGNNFYWNNTLPGYEV